MARCEHSETDLDSQNLDEGCPACWLERAKKAEADKVMLQADIVELHDELDQFCAEETNDAAAAERLRNRVRGAMARNRSQYGHMSWSAVTSKLTAAEAKVVQLREEVHLNQEMAVLQENKRLEADSALDEHIRSFPIVADVEAKLAASQAQIEKVAEEVHNRKSATDRMMGILRNERDHAEAEATRLSALAPPRIAELNTVKEALEKAEQALQVAESTVDLEGENTVALITRAEVAKEQVAVLKEALTPILVWRKKLEEWTGGLRTTIGAQEVGVGSITGRLHRISLMTELDKYKAALRKIGGLAEQRRNYDNRDELAVRMGDIANKALHNRRGPGTQVYRGFSPLTCKDCKLMKQVCSFHKHQFSSGCLCR